MSPAPATTLKQSAAGFGDPMFEFNLNLVGPKAQKNIPDVLRYQPGFTIDLLADLAVPIGEYDNSQSLNIGQNRWYGRIGAPILFQLGVVGARPAHDAGVPAGRVVLRPQRRLRRQHPEDRPDVPGGRARDA